MTSLHLRPTRRAFALTIFGATLAATSLPTFATGDTFYSGRATGVGAVVTVLGIRQSVTVSDNFMSCQGLPKSETLYTLNNPTPLGIGVDEAYTFTQGRDGTALTKARISGLRVDVPGFSMGSALIESRAQATCDDSNVVTLTGKSTVGTLTINGQTYTATGQANQKITIPGIADITLNEQKRYVGEIRVIGVHVKLLTSNTLATGDVQVAAAKAKISCE